MVMMEMYHFQKVVVLAQAAFQEGRLVEEATRKAVVLIPRGGGDYHGIVLVEVLMVIINRCFTTSIAFHDLLHGLWAGCVKGNASIEAKLLQQLEAMRGEVLLKIFLDLHKAYDTLDRDR